MTPLTPATATEAPVSTHLSLVITVRFAEGRFHGRGDWPPSPARLFQAMVAGTGTSGRLSVTAKDALEWLEALPPPMMGAPPAKDGADVTFFVPRNDADVLRGGRPEVDRLRYPKSMKPRLFDETIPFIYAWTFAREDKAKAETMRELAHAIYRLGHGVDSAWASAEVVETVELGERLKDYAGHLYKPTGGTRGLTLAAPTGGSTRSIIASYEAGLRAIRGDGGTIVRFQPPRPLFTAVRYNSPPLVRLFDMRAGEDYAAWNAASVSELALVIRRAAAERLAKSLPALGARANQAFEPRVGTLGGSVDALRVLPLPSIGHRHADGAVRRVLVGVPPNCPIRPDDVFWALSGLEMGEGTVLVTAADNDRMLHHYGVESPGHTRWYTVTPAVMPDGARRRRIEPTRRHEEAKPAKERTAEEMLAANAVLQDLRSVQLLPELLSVRVQREPFEGNGARAEAFASGSGIAKERLWHVEVSFARKVQGPLIVGQGGLFGLGIMAPRRAE